ncbi:MAG: ion transporter [Marinilabiliales bacterium]|nr:MAG: ion transporter [Marinilabiliales bacterium]
MTLKEKLHDIVFEADTREGKIFDVVILILILLSILLVMLESVKEIEIHFDRLFYFLEWIITIVFTIEYILRIIITRRPIKYIFSFYGIIDLLAVAPTYMGLILSGVGGLVVIRAMRLLRVFRIFKLTRYTNEARNIMLALRASKAKLLVFLFSVLTIVTIIGTLMYLIEGSSSGFTSIPRSMYWAIVTLTTVGYGDIAPQTAFGQLLSSFVMILGYAIIAVPTGIVSVEISRLKKHQITTQICPECMKEGHDSDASHCKFCGSVLNEESDV